MKIYNLMPSIKLLNKNRLLSKPAAEIKAREGENLSAELTSQVASAIRFGKKSNNYQEKLYRADIDGLRAIAVLLVVFYHAGFKSIAGGFVGVDIFFVISGYLITSLIINKIKSNTFSFREFYLHRLRRLTPAFVFVCFVTTIFAFFILLPYDLCNYIKSLLSSFFSLANIFFWKHSSGYFFEATEQFPLLHTWSLSVEEQYYLLWPICLIISYRFLSRKFGLIAIGLLFFTIGISQWASIHSPNFAYFGLPTRFFELMIGCLLAYYWDKIPLLKHSYNHILSVIGLLLIMYSGFYLEKNAFPGIYALLPCFGAAILITTGKQSVNIGVVNQLLSAKILAWLGLISYSLYLWHWPFLAYLHYVDADLNPLTGSLVILISIILAAITWRYVEVPFRFKYKFNLPKTITFFLIFPILIISYLVFTTLNNRGFEKRFDPIIINMSKTITIYAANVIRGNCHSSSKMTPLSSDQCRLGLKTKSQVDALIIGDSHANSITGMLDVLLKNAKLRGYDITADSTPYLPGLKSPVSVLGPNSNYVAGFKTRNNFLSSLIQNTKFKYVILASAWGNYSDKLKKNSNLKNNNSYISLKTGLENALQVITTAGSIPVIVMDVPTMKTRADCEINNRRWNRKINCDLPLNEDNLRQSAVRAMLVNLRLKYPQIIYIDPKKIMCDQKNCFSSMDNVPLFIDNSHLSYYGAELIGKFYLKKFNNRLV